MILYADTSALVKKYIREASSAQVLSLFEQYPVIGTVSLTQVEMAAALSKAVRQGWVSEADAAVAWNDFLGHWPSYARLPLSAAVLERATDLAWRHGLRAYDSVHLSSALFYQEMTGEQETFACFDRRLQQAAAQEDLLIWPDLPQE